jgi:UDP-N-acetylmuramoyl-L-alanyl-D-glutamate--2,6-diaminopimelate ligase
MNMAAADMTPVTTLADLLQGFAEAPPVPVEGIASDSRHLRKGYLFLAVDGLTSHGLDYLDEAQRAGACAVAWDASTGAEPATAGLPLIAVHGLAEKLGEIANRFYGFPSTKLEVIGTTGTNGKTTVAWLIAQAAAYLGESCAYLGTLGHGVDEIGAADGMTTPPAVELHGHLAEFVAHGAKLASIEVSSHALSQRRVDGVRFDTALFTNISRDHLDYHADMGEYFASKARLFLDCAPRHRIVNVDSQEGERLASLCGPDVVIVATDVERVADSRPYLFVREVEINDEGARVAFASSWGGGRFALHMPGDFNVANAAAVLALLLMKGAPLAQACDVMGELQAPPGRMQRVATEGPAVYIDYAHTPSALEGALRALRPHCRGALWCVFGCGGDRDRGKRPQMGEVAERHGDRVVLTTDNPRTEKPLRIIEDVQAGFSQPDRAIVLEDRAAAIAWTVEQAAAGDVVLIAGKGHENYQEVDGKRLAISDYSLAAKALAAREPAPC